MNKQFAQSQINVRLSKIESLNRLRSAISLDINRAVEEITDQLNSYFGYDVYIVDQYAFMAGLKIADPCDNSLTGGHIYKDSQIDDTYYTEAKLADVPCIVCGKPWGGSS